jgi:hypothetical protein
MQGGAAALAMLIIGRIIAGFSIGLLTSPIPMYCSEIAPAKYRGALAGLLPWMLSWGFLAAQWLGYGSTFVDSSFQCTFPRGFHRRGDAGQDRTGNQEQQLPLLQDNMLTKTQGDFHSLSNVFRVWFSAQAPSSYTSCRVFS